MKHHKVIFQPSGRRGEIEEGKTVLEASRELGVEIESLCGEQRVCGKCKVRLEEGVLSPFTEEEGKFLTDVEKIKGFRLLELGRAQPPLNVQ